MSHDPYQVEQIDMDCNAMLERKRAPGYHQREPLPVLLFPCMMKRDSYPAMGFGLWVEPLTNTLGT